VKAMPPNPTLTHHFTAFLEEAGRQGLTIFLLRRAYHSRRGHLREERGRRHINKRARLPRSATAPATTHPWRCPLPTSRRRAGGRQAKRATGVS